MGTPSKKISKLPSLETLITVVNDSQTTSSDCYCALVKIREHISNPQFLSDFISSEGIKAIIVQLKKPYKYKKLVDVSLSILTHCVNKSSEQRIQFRSEGGLPVLVSVLKNFEDVNSIQQRACRVIGSLAQEKRNISKLLDLYVFIPLGLIAIRSTDEETLSMCIRAVHKLSDSKQHVALLGRNFIFHRLTSLLINSDSTRVIKQLFAFFSHLWENYLKLFSETSSHYWIGSQDGGKLVQKLVDLRQHCEPAIADKAPKLLQQLIQNAHVRSSLASLAAFQALIPIVKAENKASQKTTVFTTSLLLLCRESSHLFTEAGGIELLIDLIRDSDPSNDSTHLHSQHSIIFSTLIAFKDDASSLAKLVDAGIVKLLIAKVARYNGLCKLDKLDQEEGLTSKFCEHDDYQSTEHLNDDDQMDSAPSTPQNCCHPGCKVRCRRKRQYRTTSPSYQAVEYEYNQLSRFREYATKNSDEPVLNIFGYRLYNDNDQDCNSPSSSPQHSTGGSIEESVSPNHSSENWSDYEEDLDEPTGENEWSYAASPAHSESSSIGSHSTEIGSVYSSAALLFSSDDFEDEENETVCYSPTIPDFEIDLSPSENAQLTCNKKRRYDYDKHLASEKRLCCETDIKMLWLKLGFVECKDFYENWPEFSAETHQIQQQTALYILHKISWLEDAPKELSEPQCLKTLIEYLNLTPRPTFRACQILFRIASCSSLFVNLLKNKFPLDIFASFNSRVTSNHCCPLHNSLYRVGQQILEQLSEIVLKFGHGEMEYIMTNQKVANDLESIKIAAMTTPVIVKSRNLLRRYITDFNVLDIICSLLTSAEMRGYATVSLTSLGTFLKMEDLLISPHVNDMEDFYDRTACQIDVDEEEDVQFLINSGVTVGGIKNRLQVSNFFQAMFRGGFKESTSDKVTLADVEAPVLRVILHTEYGCGTGCGVIQSLNRLVTDWKSALSLLQNLDRFLLLDKVERVCSLIANQDWIRCPSSFVSLWQSIGPGFQYSLKLRNHLQYFPFSNAAELNCRVKVIEAVLQSQAAEESVRFWKEMFIQRIDDN